MNKAETFLDGRLTLHSGDSREVLRSLPENCIDSVVTDAPYALVSIVKRFGGKNAAAAKVPEGGSGVYARASSGFMGKQWDTGETAFDPLFWAEVLRVLKPGGHIVAFSGTRTYHRMTCAIEDAGFEIRDQIGWAFGSGFPKSHDVSKGIDKALGAKREKVRVASIDVRNPKATGAGRDGMDGATRPFIERALERGYHEKDGDEPVTAETRRYDGWGTALKPAWEPVCLARKPLIGTVAANVMQHGTGALNIDGCRVATDDGYTENAVTQGINTEPSRSGRWPANIAHDGSHEVIGAFPEIKTARSTVTSKPGSVSVNGAGLPSHTGEYGFDEVGSAARFFYQAKADADDRLGSKHPTVKPLDLMQWLCRLVTPVGGVVLDPFAGTGTTGEAAWREGFSAVLIEREEEYQADIRRRMALCLAGPDERARESIKAKTKDQPMDAGPLFGGSETTRGGGQTDIRPLRRPGRTIGPIGLKW